MRFTTCCSAFLSTVIVVSGMAVAAEHHSSHAGHHAMSAEELRVLREKIPLFREYSDEQIAMGMSRMKNSWGWVGDSPPAGDVGVLALAHGFSGHGNDQFRTAFQWAGQTYPTTYAFGMAMMTSEHIQSALTSLEEAGVEQIIVLPTTTADNSTLVRQWDYIFGKENESAYLDVPRVRTNATVTWADTPTAHPIMASIMLDYALDHSGDPANELVIIMGHGPQSKEDNEKELAILAQHASFLKGEGGFADVKFANVQDDAPKAVRAANVAMIRGWAQDAIDAGRDVIAVTTALTYSGVVDRMRQDVDGVATFDGRGLMEHHRFAEWITAAVATTQVDTSQ